MIWLVLLKELGRKFYINQFDCVSVESKEVYEFIKDYFEKVYKYKNVFYVPNGFFVPSKFSDLSFSWAEKENVMMTVGRLGSTQKANEVLLGALGKIKDAMIGWKVYFVGNIASGFKEKIDEFFLKHPDLKGRIIFTGIIEDREKLCALLQKSKIFCLTSRWEGFPNSLIEAGFFRNYLVATRVAGAQDILDYGNLGDLFYIDDVNQLASILKRTIHDDKALEEKSSLQRKWVLENFNWNKICGSLHQALFKNKTD